MRKVKLIWISQKQGSVNGSGISWAICKSAPRCRQITTPAPHHSAFYRPDALPAAQPTASTHWRQCNGCKCVAKYLRVYFLQHDESSSLEGIDVFRSILELIRGKTMLDYTAYVNRLLVMHWSGTLESMSQRGASRQQVQLIALSCQLFA